MKYLPYGRQEIDDADIAAVTAALRSEWLTTGPIVDQFETDFARYTGARYAISVSNGTAALHAIMHAIGIGAGDGILLGGHVRLRGVFVATDYGRHCAA